jgi:2-dehydropantoate 2-reductase
VPEPEFTLVISPDGKTVGYTIGNDMSARDIEGENPLYLPQALSERTVGEVMADPDLSKVSAACASEGYAVAVTKGVKLDFTDPVAYVREFGAKIPNARPSVLLDLMAGRKSEIDVINGSIPRVGKQVGVAAPVNETITALVKAKETKLGCK